MTEEKTYTIPLRSRWLRAAKYRRSKRAIGALREYLQKHLKQEVRIGKYLNHSIWTQGHKRPPGKVKVRIEEDEKDKTLLTAELFDAPRTKKEDKKESKKEVKKEIVKETKQEEVKENKTEAVKPQPKFEKPVQSNKQEVKTKVGH